MSTPLSDAAKAAKQRYAERHPDRVKESKKRSWANHPEWPSRSKKYPHKPSPSGPYRPEARMDRHRRKAYGLEPSEYRAMVERQGGRCAICRKPESNTYRGKPTELAVDHDHVTGRVRGLLCRGCNQAIGIMRDDPVILRRAAEYLDAVH